MTESGPNRRASRLIPVLLLVLSGCVATVLGGRAVTSVPIAFDGGFNLQVARTLVEKGRYATTYRRLNDLDHRVQTGPAVIVPAAFALRHLGVNATSAQLPNLAYLVLLFLLATALALRHGGLPAAILAPLLLLGVPQLFSLGLGVLGEVPAVAFFLAGLLALDVLADRRWLLAAFVAGACFALVVSTKFMLLLAVAAAVAVALLDRRTARRLEGRHRLAAVAGFVAATLPFELYRLRELGWSGFLDWWDVMLRRSIGQGTSMRMPASDAIGLRAADHLEVLARALNLPAWIAAVLVLAPLIALAACIVRDRTGRPRAPWPALSVLALAASCAALLGWWLAVSPSSHAWLRRALPGLILLAVLSAVALAETGRRLLAAARAGGPELRRRTVGAAATVWAGVLLVWLWLAGAGLSAAAALATPTPERQWTEVIAHRINQLPDDAVVYATGWYEAPVLAALTGRSFRDLDCFPVTSYRRPLTETYFVVDHHLAQNRPDEVAAVLARSSHELLQEAGPCALYRLRRVDPYPPLPEPRSPGELRTRLHPGELDYPFAGGTGEEGEARAWARAVSGFLLDRAGLDCLELDLWVPAELGRAKVLRVVVDGHTELAARLPVESSWRRTIPLPSPPPPPGQGTLVELWVERFGPSPPHRLWFDDLGTLVVVEVGFVPCPRGAAAAAGDEP